MIYINGIFFRDLESQNLIDSTSNLAQTKVYIVHGEFDTIVNPVHAWKVKQFYEGFGLDSSKVQSFKAFLYNLKKKKSSKILSMNS